MVIEIKPREEDVDVKAMRVFLKAIELLGGPRKLIEYRNLTWLPSLMSASYAVVYHKEKNYSAETIANLLGISTTTVKNILSADEEIAKEKIEAILKEEKLEEERKTHTAGALAKMAYKEIIRGRDEINIMLHLVQETSRSLGIDWAVRVLSMVKGIDFPLTKDVFLERFGGLSIRGKMIEEIANKISFPINTPSELLHKIKEAMED